MVLDDKRGNELDRAAINRVLAPKVQGAINPYELTLALNRTVRGYELTLALNRTVRGYELYLATTASSTKALGIVLC